MNYRWTTKRIISGVLEGPKGARELQEVYGGKKIQRISSMFQRRNGAFSDNSEVLMGVTWGPKRLQDFRSHFRMFQKTLSGFQRCSRGVFGGFSIRCVTCGAWEFHGVSKRLRCLTWRPRAFGEVKCLTKIQRNFSGFRKRYRSDFVGIQYQVR